MEKLIINYIQYSDCGDGCCSYHDLETDYIELEEHQYKILKNMLKKGDVYFIDLPFDIDVYKGNSDASDIYSRIVSIEPVKKKE